MTKLTMQQHFDALWLAETIRLQEEEQGAFADNEAIRQAKKKGGDFQSRVLTRAQYLANKTNLGIAQKNAVMAMHWAVRILCVFAFFMGIGLILPTFSAAEHTINIFSALGCLLGLNLVMLIVWLIGIFFGGQSVNQLGRFSLWLTSKLTGKKQVIQLMPAFFSLLCQKHLERWLLGRLTNALWLLASVTALFSLLLLLATQRYGFIWQTTILSADNFVMVVHFLGYLPSLIGFPIPSETLIIQSGDIPVMADSARQAWAAWLVGVLVVYGILPRLILFLVCNLFWRHGYKRLKLDLTKSAYLLLKSRLLPDSEIIGVTDLAPNQLSAKTRVSNEYSEQGAMIVGIELDPNYPWPPVIPHQAIDGGVIESREQRKALLERLTFEPLAKLLIVCDPKRSIDRGTLTLISELAYCVAEVKVLLLADQATDINRLEDWQQALDQLQLTYDDSDDLLTWLNAEHE